MNTIEQFKYTEKNLNSSSLTWSELQQKSHTGLSEFDTFLRSRWTTAMADGHFKYTLDDMKTRIVPGQRAYVLQLNLKRGSERRRPEQINTLTLPFDSSKFNFTKVRPGEVLCEMCPVDSLGSDDCQNEKGCGRHLLLINVSPCEFGHVLLVPEIDGELPQVLTLKVIHLALEMQLLSTHPGFHVAFNSLCALASVNHLHLHAWYLEYPLHTDNTPVQEVVSGCYETTDHPCRALVFQLHNSTLELLARNVYLVTSYMQNADIAHNVLVSRGEVIGENSGITMTTVRVYIWPRTSVTGVKTVTRDTVFNVAAFEYAGHIPMFGSACRNQSEIFNVAAAEIAGHIPMYAPDLFETLTEEEIEKKVNMFSLSTEEFSAVKANVVKILSPH